MHTPHIKIGAYEAGSWNGIAFIIDNCASFQLRIGMQAEFGDYLDGDISSGYRIAGRQPEWSFRALFRTAPFYYAVSEVGAHAPDQSYCRLGWNPVYPYDSGAQATLEWCRIDDETVIGRVSYDAKYTAKEYNDCSRHARIVLEANAPWHAPVSFTLRDDAIVGQADAAQPISFVVVGDQAPASTGTFHTLQELQQQMQEQCRLSSTGGDGVAGLHYEDIHLANKISPVNNVLHLAAKVGSDQAQILADARRLLAAGMIDAMIHQRAEHYAQQRVTVEGAYPHTAAMISNSVEWGALYSPEQRRTFTVDCRSWALPNSWVLFANSAVMTALACGLEDPQLARETFRGVMTEQLPDGRVMNAADPRGGTPDHSEDMYDAYVLWKLYLKWRDKEFLREMYPRVKAWNRWWFADRGDGQPWRDGNEDGLLGLGSNLSSFGAPQAPFESEMYGRHHQQAMNESGYDDSPMWGYYPNGGNFVQPNEQYLGEKRVRFLFPTGTFNLDNVETNCLYALDTEILALIAEEAGSAEDAARFRREYQRIKARINDYLWDDVTGMYLNRFWPEYGGEFSYVKTPIMFYALAAGIPSPKQARRLIEEHLLNPRSSGASLCCPPCRAMIPVSHSSTTGVGPSGRR